MKYIVVAWNPDSKEYEILHYSHNLDDAKKWYDKCREKYSQCSFLVDYHTAVASSKTKEFMDRLRSILNGTTTV